MTPHRAALAVSLSLATALVGSACSAPSDPAPEPEPMAAAPDRAGDEAAIRAVIELAESAHNSMDAATYAAQLTPDGDAAFMESPRVRGRAALEALQGQSAGATTEDRQVSISVDEIRFVADDVAILDATADFTTSEPFAQARGTAVMVRTADGWQWEALRIYPAAAQP